MPQLQGTRGQSTGEEELNSCLIPFARRSNFFNIETEEIEIKRKVCVSYFSHYCNKVSERKTE